MPVVLQNNLHQPDVYRHVQRLMGNRFEFTLTATLSDQAMAGMEAAVTEVQRIERLLTTYDPNSQANAINQMAGIGPVPVDPEVFDLIARSIKISNLTQGAFDITYGSVDKRLWNFDTTMTSLPDPKTLRKAVRLINFRNVILDENNHSVFLKEPGMRIGFGGIGKGYAAERARFLLQEAGFQSGIVNASGDLTTWGFQADGKPWTIGITDPDASQKAFSSVNITGLAVATSGNYEKYVMVGGKRYSHTIDPRTGWPVSGIKSVTILCPNAELADALATPVMIMGKEVGLHLVDQLKNVACILVDDDNCIHTSKNIQRT